MGNVIQAAERFTRDLPRANAERPVKWICIDDRYALIEGPYRQTAGGLVGVGQDVNNAIAMGNRGDTTPSTVKIPTQILGSIVSKTLLPEGVQLLLHADCAAEAKAQAIRQIEITNDPTQRDELFERSGQIYPELTSSKFEQAREAKAAARIMSPNDAIPHVEHGLAWQQSAGGIYTLEPTKRVALVDSSHVSAIMLADWRPEVAFDTRAAFTAPKEARMPAYHASFGDMPHEIAGPLSDVFGFKVEDLLAATAIRHAAVSMALPVPENHQQIAIHSLAA